VIDNTEIVFCLTKAAYPAIIPQGALSGAENEGGLTKEHHW
jgi:hypothetical protein